MKVVMTAVAVVAIAAAAYSHERAERLEAKIEDVERRAILVQRNTVALQNGLNDVALRVMCDGPCNRIPCTLVSGVCTNVATGEFIR